MASGHSCSNPGKTQNEIQHGADQTTPSIRRETNYVEQDELEETENQNMGPQGLADEGEMIHSIVDEIEAEDQTAIKMEEYEGSSDDEQYSLPKRVEGAWFWQSYRRRCTKSGVGVQRE